MDLGIMRVKIAQVPLAALPGTVTTHLPNIKTQWLITPGS